jgi:hypothetical protein
MVKQQPDFWWLDMLPHMGTWQHHVQDVQRRHGNVFAVEMIHDYEAVMLYSRNRWPSRSSPSNASPSARALRTSSSHLSMAL